MIKKILGIASAIIAITFASSVAFYSTTALTPKVAKADVSIAYGVKNYPNYNTHPVTYTQQQYMPAPPAQVVYQYIYQYPCANSFYNSPCTPVVPPTPAPATITDISGPTTITVNQPGTWVVDVSSANTNTNSVLSVMWADPSYSNSGVPQVTHTIYGNQTFSFAHTFNSLGVYYVTFTIEDSIKHRDSKTILVKVIERNYPFY